jgi:hypothetical protein
VYIFNEIVSGSHHRGDSATDSSTTVGIDIALPPAMQAVRVNHIQMGIVPSVHSMGYAKSEVRFYTTKSK